MRVMVLVKATKDSEAGVMPSAELLEAMGRFNKELAEAGSWTSATRLRPSRPVLRRALQARDRRCRPPACRHRRVDAHHIEDWADGRRTALDNPVLFCRRHHLSVATLTASPPSRPRRGNGDFTCVMLKGSLPSPFAP